ncbi:MAG: hypothetical protein IPI65_14595 [Bacteroidetes bacterium]|nr:hypothetical protein [Bacteroidota bacterium]
MRCFLLLLISVLGQQIIAQTYCRSFGDTGTEYSGKSIQTSDDGFLITGNSNSWSGDFFDFISLKLTLLQTKFGAL